MESLIRLFNAVPVKSTSKGKLNKAVMAETNKCGFIFSERVFGNYSESELVRLVERVNDEIGISAKQMNSAFHKSWKKVATATDEQLVVEQIIHYFTTYGLESLGLYDKDNVYIPDEVLKLPKTNPDKLRLIVINGYTKDEIKEKLMTLLKTGIAMKESTIKDVVDVAMYVKLSKSDIHEVRNKEVKVAMYEFLDMIPDNAIEFIRYLVYRTTDKTLLIKNKQTYNAIKDEKNSKTISILLRKYEMEYGLKPLAEVFNRFKPLFMACRTSSASKSIVNEISKKSKMFHKPMLEDYLNTITAKIKRDDGIEKDELERELKKANVFRKIRLAYALNYRLKNPSSILYKIRNGKGYATEFSSHDIGMTESILEQVEKSIIKDMKPQVNGKKIYIPDNMKYALPATEKQFTGNLPSGSYIVIPKDMIVGVHWEDVGAYNRIDLDLSLINADSKYGWDGGYRSEDRDILFSGDMTSAPKPDGATELFYVKRQIEKTFILMLNYYNFDKETPVPFKLFVAKEGIRRLDKNYMVNPANVLVNCETKAEQKQKMLGLLVATEKECRFYFSEAYIGNSISSSNSEYSEHSRKYLVDYNTNPITLNDLLYKAGANVVGIKDGSDIDLSPEALQKDSIINLLKKA